MYTIYVIENEISRIYVGYTEDMEKRLKRHNGELPTKTSSFTYKNKKGKWRIIYTEKTETREDAIKREKQLKSYQGRQFIKNLAR